MMQLKPSGGDCASALYHRLPAAVWLHVSSFLQPCNMASASHASRDWLRDRAYVLCLWRRLNMTWCAWVRNLVRQRLSPVTSHPLWPLACYPSPIVPHCAACGHDTVPLTTHTFRWHVVVYSFGTGVHTGVDRTRRARLCPACTQRCTLNGKHAMRTLLHAAVDEYTPSPTRGPPEAPEPLPWVAAEDNVQSTVVMFDDHCRYLRADVDAMAARPGWGSHSIERIDFTSHRTALEWRTGWQIVHREGSYRRVRPRSVLPH